MHGQELLDAIGQMNSEQLQKFCSQDAENGDDESAAMELESLLFDALFDHLGYDVRQEDTPEADIITQLVEAMDIPTSWQMIMQLSDEE